MFEKICAKYLPIYINFWSTQYQLAIWSAPIRYQGNENIKARNDTAWQALRITIRYGGCKRLLATIKHGIV